VKDKTMYSPGLRCNTEDRLARVLDEDERSPPPRRKQSKKGPKRKPGKNISEAERNTVRVQLRLAPEEAGLLRAQAGEADMPVSDFVAQLLTKK